MRRRLLINGAVVLLALLLAAVAWVDLAGPSGTPRLTTLQPDDIRVVRIQDADGDTLRVVRQDGGWIITDPVQAPASRFHVEQLLELSRAPSERRYAAEDMDPQELGLIPPQIMVAFNGTGISLGDTDPLDGLRYAMVDDRIHLVSDGLMPLLDGPWWNFLDRHLLPRTSQVVALETTSLKAHADGDRWRVEAGDLDADAVPDLVAAWEGAEALVARPLESPPDAAAADVHLRLSDGSEQRFATGEEGGEIRMVNIDSGVAYVLPDHVRAYLLSGREE